MDSDSQLCFSHQYEYVYPNFTENFERCYVANENFERRIGGENTHQLSHRDS